MLVNSKINWINKKNIYDYYDLYVQPTIIDILKKYAKYSTKLINIHDFAQPTKIDNLKKYAHLTLALFQKIFLPRINDQRAGAQCLKNRDEGYILC